MKQILVLLMAVATTLSAADNKPVTAAAPSATASWINSITVAPVGAIRTIDLNGRSEWGAGLDLGVKVNPFVSIHVVNLAFEGPGQNTQEVKTKETFGTRTTGPNSWAGSAIDETDVLLKARINKFSNESVSLYGIGGGLHTWEKNDRWGLSVGAGLEYRFNKNFGLGADYSVRMYNEADAKGSSLDSLVRAMYSAEQACSPDLSGQNLVPHPSAHSQ
jgi:opacity protein-like surface antigen